MLYIPVLLGSTRKGRQSLARLRLVTLGMGAFPVPASLPVSRVQDTFDDQGNPLDPLYEKRAASFLAEVIWFAEAIKARREKDDAA
jgi:NAD(P)H-dependent FMN reductase